MDSYKMTDKQPIPFDELCIKIALLVSERSKDKHTKVGCVALSPCKTKLSWGWNAFPSKIKETQDRLERPLKYKYFLHSEMSMIINTKESLEGWDIYLTMPPCEDCAKALIHAKVNKILYLDEPNNPGSYDYQFAKEMLKEANIEVIRWKN